MFDDDIFGGSPQDRFYDILTQANRNVVEEEFNKIFKRMAALEMMLGMEEEELEKRLRSLLIEEEEVIEKMAQNFFLDSTVKIVSNSGG